MANCDDPRARREWRQGAAVMAGALAVGLVLSSCSGTSGQEPDGVPAGGGVEPAATPATQAAVSAEDQAAADLERLVRDYYAAENEVFLDPTSDPSAALDPYLRNPASAARVADVLSFRNAGHTLESSTAEVHSVAVTSLDLSADPPTATIEVCRTLTSSGRDGVSGESASFKDRGSLVWTAQATSSDSWRLYTYEASGASEC